MAIVKIRRTARQDVLLPPPREAARLAFRSIVALIVPVQVLGPGAQPGPHNGQTIAPLAQLARGTAVKVGLADQAVAPVIQVARATAVKTASGAQTIAPLVQVITMREATGGIADQTIAPVVQVVTATAVKVASADQAVTGVNQSALATAVKLGAAAQVIAPLTQAVTMVESARGSADQTIAPLVQVVMATAVASGSAAQTVAAMAQVATATAVGTGAADQAMAGVTQSVTATAVKVGAADQTPGGVSQSVIASAVNQATADQATAPLGQAVTATKVARALADQTVGGAAQTATATAVASGSAVQAMAGATQGATATPVARAMAAQTIAPVMQAVIGKPYRLWTIAHMASAPYVLFDSRTVTWSSSNFSSAPNGGSLGGTWGIKRGTPTKAANDINGVSALALNSAGIFLSALVATLPAGNRTSVYVSKRTGAPPAYIGMMMGQSGQQPGWGIYDQINTTATFSNGHTVHAGDSGMAGWPAGTSNFHTDVGVTPPTDDGQYHITICKTGTQTYWRRDGAALTPIFHSEASLPAVTGDFTIGTSYSNQDYIGNTVLDAQWSDISSDDEQKLEGWLSWDIAGDGSLLVSGHPYKTTPPTVF